MSLLIPIREHFMTITEKKFSSTKTKCPRRIFNSIVLASIFGLTLPPNASKDLEINKAPFTRSIEKFLSLSRVRKARPISQEMTYKSK